MALATAVVLASLLLVYEDARSSILANDDRAHACALDERCPDLDRGAVAAGEHLGKLDRVAWKADELLDGNRRPRLHSVLLAAGSDHCICHWENLEALQFCVGRVGSQRQSRPPVIAVAGSSAACQIRGTVTDRVLVILAKEPRPGEVKTRLCPPLTPDQASRCQQAFLGDLVNRLTNADGARIVLAASPDRDAPWIVGLAREHGLELRWQGGGDLGRRMARMLAAALRTPETATILLGADSPDLPLDLISAAWAALERVPCVVGPAEDGGYYLFGARGKVPPVFHRGIAWGGAAVLEATLDRLMAAGVGYELLPQWYDVDDVAGLGRLAARLERSDTSCGNDRLERTERLLADLTREGILH